VDADPAAEQSCRNHSRVVEDDEFVTSEQGRKFGEEVIFKLTGRPAQSEKARGVTAVEGTLSDLFAGKAIIKLVETHRGSLAAIHVRLRIGGR